MSPESVRRWVREAEVASGQRLGLASTSEMAELRRRNAELEATVQVLKAATSFFAREYDPLPSWSTGSSTSTETGSPSDRSVGS
jgi:transposase